MLSSLCVLIKYKEDSYNNLAAWEFAGGCFEDGEIAKYVPGQLDQHYDFDNVEIEVRQLNDSETEEPDF